MKELAVEESEIVMFVCMLLGGSLSQKLQAGRVLDILGVNFNLSKGRLLILEDRRTRILVEIDQILSSGLLSPGQAGKLRGKLLFIGGHYAGRHDRCHLRPLADRQYAIGGTRVMCRLQGTRDHTAGPRAHPRRSPA